MGRATAAISVLLVEDEVMISNLVADCLNASGFSVHEVTNADEALRFIKSGADRCSGHGYQSARDHERGQSWLNVRAIFGQRCRSSTSRAAISFPKLPRWCRARYS